MAGLHPWAAAVQAVRAGHFPPENLPGSGRLTPNQEAGAGAQGCEYARFAPAGHPLDNATAAAHAAARLVEGLDRERQGGLWGGEGPSTYALQHCLARAVALTSVRVLRRHYPGLVLLQEAHRHLVGWWRAVATLALEWRGKKGIVRGVGDRAKHASADEPGGEDPLGLDIVADWLLPLPDSKLHPTLWRRLRATSLDHRYYTVHRQTHRMLILELRSLGDHLLPFFQVLGLNVLPRLQEGVYWRHDPGIHLLMPVVIANPDSDGKKSWVDPVVRWIPGAGYREEPGAEVQKGVTATWEEQEDGDGHLIRNVYLRAIQGVPAGTHLPHPEGAVPLGGGWIHAGPSTPPYPIPSIEEVDGEGVVKPPPPPPPPPCTGPQVSIVARRHLQRARTRVAEALAHVERPGERPQKRPLLDLLRRAQRQLTLLRDDLRIETDVADPLADVDQPEATP